MVERFQPEREKMKDSSPKQEPGLLEYHGTFPVWLLKIIDLIIPSFLKSKFPPKDRK